MSKFYRTIESANLKSIINTVVSAINEAESEYNDAVSRLDADRESGKITGNYYADEKQKAFDTMMQRLDSSRIDAGRGFDAIIMKLRELSEQAPMPEITNGERNAIEMLKAIENPTADLFNSAVKAWGGNPITGAILRDIAAEHYFPFDGKPKTTEMLTSADILDIAESIRVSAKMYLDSVANMQYVYDGDPLHSREVEMAMRAAGKKQLLEIAGKDNVFDFDGNTAKAFAFDDLCNTAEISESN